MLIPVTVVLGSMACSSYQPEPVPRLTTICGKCRSERTKHHTMGHAKDCSSMRSTPPDNINAITISHVTKIIWQKADTDSAIHISTKNV